MPRNYDTTKRIPYPRITEVTLRYPESGLPVVEYTEVMAIVDATGQVQHLDRGATRHVMDLTAITEPVQIPDPATGQPIPGQTAEKRQVMLGLLAYLRADQLRRDAEADNAAGAA
ncbi:MAG: hypothetical protein RL758_48 [Pseudomonadota bacterium]|jgi:hypothetical protein